MEGLHNLLDHLDVVICDTTVTLVMERYPAGDYVVVK